MTQASLNKFNYDFFCFIVNCQDTIIYIMHKVASNRISFLFTFLLLLNIAAAQKCNSVKKEEKTLDLILGSEGACQNWKSDTGNKCQNRIGFTCKGITPCLGYQNQALFPGCGGFSGHPSGFNKWCYDKSIPNFTKGASAIYKTKYFNKCSHLDMPAYYVCSDICVLSGPGGLQKMIDRSGPVGSNMKDYARRLNENHRKYLISLNRPEFIKGWLNRVNHRANFINSCT